MLAGVVVALGLTTAYVGGLTPSFEAATLVTVSDRASGVEFGGQQPRQGTLAPGLALEDQLRLIESRAMAERLVDRLDLQLVPEFNPLLGGDGAGGTDDHWPFRQIPMPMVDWLREAWPDPLESTLSGADLTDYERAARLRDRVVEAAAARIRADLAGPSTIRLSFVSENPELAAAGASALAELYLDERATSWREAGRAEGARLAREIERLTASISTTEKAIEELRATPAAGLGRPSEQDLLGLTGELAFWRDERAQVEARLSRLQASGEFGAGLNQSTRPVDSAPLGALEAREGELKRELAALSGAYGDQDPRIPSLRDEHTTLAVQPRAEVEQTAEQLERELEIIRSRETALEARVKTLEEQPAKSLAGDGLTALERQLEADRGLLQVYRDRAGQLEAPPPQEPDARIVAPAALPSEPAYPRLAVVYPSALGAGLLLGIVLALALEALHWTRV